MSVTLCAPQVFEEVKRRLEYSMNLPPPFGTAQSDRPAHTPDKKTTKRPPLSPAHSGRADKVSHFKGIGGTQTTPVGVDRVPGSCGHVKIDVDTLCKSPASDVAHVAVTPAHCSTSPSSPAHSKSPPYLAVNPTPVPGSRDRCIKHKTAPCEVSAEGPAAANISWTARSDEALRAILDAYEYVAPCHELFLQQQRTTSGVPRGYTTKTTIGESCTRSKKSSQVMSWHETPPLATNCAAQSAQGMQLSSRQVEAGSRTVAIGGYPLRQVHLPGSSSCCNYDENCANAGKGNGTANKMGPGAVSVGGSGVINVANSGRNSSAINVACGGSSGVIIANIGECSNVLDGDVGGSGVVSNDVGSGRPFLCQSTQRTIFAAISTSTKSTYMSGGSSRESSSTHMRPTTPNSMSSSQAVRCSPAVALSLREGEGAVACE